MNIILDMPPKSVEIDGAEYSINWDFRTSMLYELLIQDDEVPDGRKIEEALKLYYPRIPQNRKAAVERIIWFYRCGKTDKPGIIQRTAEETDERQKPVYSFEYDADYIYGAFMGQYGIDLSTAENLHWWKFRALFKSLDDSCEIVKIIGYRGIKISGKMSKEQRAFYKKMQALHALPASQKEREQNNRLVEALMNGGDLTGLI